MRNLAMVGPQTLVGEEMHKFKYRGIHENYREFANRFATSVQDSHEHYMGFREAVLQLRYLAAGRSQAAMGSLKTITPNNCFVMPTLHDSFVHGPTEEEIRKLPEGKFPPISIMESATQAAATMRQGGGIGFDISTLRPQGDTILGVQSITDGPLAFAAIWDAVCQATSSAGNRRGAMMLVMRCDHPDIESFIHAKQAAQEIPYQYRPLRGFNMSVAVTDKLMEYKESGKPFPLIFEGKIYREVDPNALWEMIMRGTYDWAEPGVLFIDRINEWNNLYYCETIAATNPCGEQPLPPYGSCLLGSLNLAKYLIKHETGPATIDFDLIENDIPYIIRATDNIIDRARYPLVEHRKEAHNKRRMGIGVTALSNALEACGHRYGETSFLKAQEDVQRFITRQCYLASIKLAKEKGSFPLFDTDQYLASKFIQSLDEDIQELIRKHGIRNSHLTSIAPTGTISLIADNVSSGIEPVLAYKQKRNMRFDGDVVEREIFDYGFAELGIRGKRSKDVKASEHIAVLCIAQANIDSACSKTCNVPKDFPYEEFKLLYDMAYKSGAKGCTTYRSNGNYQDIITSDDIESDTCEWDPNTGQRIGTCAE